MLVKQMRDTLEPESLQENESSYAEKSTVTFLPPPQQKQEVDNLSWETNMIDCLCHKTHWQSKTVFTETPA